MKSNGKNSYLNVKLINGGPQNYSFLILEFIDWQFNFYKIWSIIHNEVLKHNRVFHQGSLQCYIYSDSFVTLFSLKNHLKHIHAALMPEINYTYQVKKKNGNADKEKKKIACEDCGEILNIGESRECEIKWKKFLSQCQTN